MTTSGSIKKPPAFLLDGKGGGRQIAHKMRDQEPPTGETLWLQLDYTDEDAQRWLTDASEIDPIVLETLLAEDTRPRCFVHGNGLLVTLRGVNLNPGEDLAVPAHDYHLIAIVEGEGVGNKAWPQLNDYTLAATNPLFVDADSNERYDSPLDWAKQLIQDRGTEDATVADVLQQVDSSVAVQYLQLVRAAYLADAEHRVSALAINARGKHPNLVEWLRSLLGIK